MTNIRSMVIFQGFSSLPEDRFINTFHFQNPLAGFEELAGVAGTLLEGFYDHVGPSTNPVSSYLSPAVQRAVTINHYDLGDPEPRVPIVDGFTIPAAPPQGGVGVPEELAVCLSYHGTPPVTPRRRGRIYFGPLGNLGTVITPSTGSSYTRIASVLINDLASAAEALVVGSGGTWVIRSTVPAENFVPIVGGWVDNAPDTQRRRGPEPSIRTLWPT